MTITGFKHKLGLPAHDIVSGFEGVIISRVQHITGCSTYGLVSKNAEGTVKDTEYFMEERLKITDGEALPWEGEMEFDKIFIHPVGARARDKITGFTGTITSRIEYMFGANSVGITPPMDKDGKLPDGYQFDEGRMEILPEPRITPKEVASPGRGAMVNRDAPRI